MSSCNAQCVSCSTGSGWVEITRRICTVLSWLTSNSLHTTMKTEGDRGSTRWPEKARWIVSWSDVISYSIYHIRSDSSLILRCKTIFHKVVPKYPDTYGTSAEVSCGQFGTGAEVSRVRSVLGPKCPGSEVSVHPHESTNLSLSTLIKPQQRLLLNTLCRGILTVRITLIISL